MKKESVIILVIVAFIAGFVVGAISGIKFYSKEHRHAPEASAPAQGMPPQGAPPPQPVSAEEISRVEAVVSKEPANLQALITLGNLYFDSNQYEKAIDVYVRALAIDPKNPDVLTDLGIMYRAVKDFDRATKEFREAARIDPNHKNSRFNLGVVLQQDKKDIKGAIAAWEDFLRVEPAGDRATSVRAEIDRLKSLAK